MEIIKIISFFPPFFAWFIYIDNPLGNRGARREDPVSCSGVRYISQVKRKILDALYRQTHLSLRPAVYEVDIGKDFFSFLVKKPRVFVGDFVNFFILVEGRTLLGAV